MKAGDVSRKRRLRKTSQAAWYRYYRCYRQSNRMFGIIVLPRDRQFKYKEMLK